MKTLRIFALLAAFAATSMAQEKFEVKPDDTTFSILTRLKSQRVEIHLKNGGKFTGKVELVGANVAHLSALTGQDFYDAVVALNDISAVVVKTK